MMMIVIIVVIVMVVALGLYFVKLVFRFAICFILLVTTIFAVNVLLIVFFGLLFAVLV